MKIQVGLKKKQRILWQHGKHRVDVNQEKRNVKEQKQEEQKQEEQKQEEQKQEEQKQEDRYKFIH